MANTLKMIDLFAGAGGLSEGLREVGFRSLYANEINPVYAGTFAHNHPNAIVESRDIREVDPAQVRRELGVARGEIDLIAGGPPCQGFSINAPKRSNEDSRNHLFREYLKFVREFSPRAVLIENVPGLVSFESGATLDAIIIALEELGYAADVRILYAPHFGVPQTRWRTIVIGMREGLDPGQAFPAPSRNAPLRVNFTSRFNGREIVSAERSIDLPAHTTVAQAISDLPELQNGQSATEFYPYPGEPESEYQELMRTGSDGIRNHSAGRLSAVNIERFSHIPAGGNWTDIPVDLLPAGMKLARRSDHTKRYGRVHPEGLASTILTKCDPHWGAYIHYSQDRAFSVREAARIQSFPDSYTFLGSKAEQYAQVGNAVPPLLAAAVGAQIRATLGERKAGRLSA